MLLVAGVPLFYVPCSRIAPFKLSVLMLAKLAVMWQACFLVHVCVHVCVDLSKQMPQTCLRSVLTANQRSALTYLVGFSCLHKRRVLRRIYA